MIAGASCGDVVLSVRGLRVERERACVLDGVSFDVLDRIRDGRTTGQVISLLGRSGAGKSTLLRILAGLDRPASGEVRGYGNEPLDARKVGIVFQDYPLLAHRTVLDNLVVAGRIGGLSTDRALARARVLLGRIGLESHGAAWPAELSGGERQRVAIAQQLVIPRRVLLLDEPFSGLDPAAIDEVIGLVTEVANEHQLNCVLIVTHDVRAAVAVSDTILLLGRANERASGARIAATYDLVDLGIAWSHGTVEQTASLTREIEQRFRSL